MLLMRKAMKLVLVFSFYKQRNKVRFLKKKKVALDLMIRGGSYDKEASASSSQNQG
jgi:hypothetical protein